MLVLLIHIHTRSYRMQHVLKSTFSDTHSLSCNYKIPTGGKFIRPVS